MVAPLRPVPPSEEPTAEERLRRVAMILRQGLYFVADELGREFGIERPCKSCDEQRRRDRRA